MVRMGAIVPIVKGSELLVPPTVVTVINCGPTGAPGKIVNVAEIEVAVVVTPVTLM